MPPVETYFGQLNIVFGWVWMVLGIISGSIIGMWAFAGPLPAPRKHKDYADLSRRLVRLAHIAMFALPMISILYGMFIDQAILSDDLKHCGSICMIICMIGIPTFLILASFKIAFKYFEVIPVGAGMVALFIMAYGQYLKYLTY